MLEAGLVASRLVHFTCVIILFGSAFFVLYSGPSTSGSDRLAHLFTINFRACAVGALLSGLAWFLFTAANMSGALAGMFDSETLSSVLYDTGYGRMWVARVAPMLLIVAMVWLRGSLMLSHRPIRLLVLLCHKFCRCLRDDRRMQHWHRCRVIAIATANKRWMVAIELGTWRCGRIGGAAGSVTAGKGRFFDRSGAMRC